MSDGRRMSESRRAFLKKAAGAVPGVAIAGTLGAGACAPDEPSRETDGAARSVQMALPEAPLRAVAEVALPTGALGTDATETAVLAFMVWVEEFEPAAELDHAYLTGELRYGPPHPAPRWAAQLEAMDLESQRRTGQSFAELSAGERRTIVEEAIRGEDSADLPGSAARADHVAVGLLAWFYGTWQANDLCYRAEVGRHLCRGIASLPQEPAPLGGS